MLNNFVKIVLTLPIFNVSPYLINKNLTPACTPNIKALHFFDYLQTYLCDRQVADSAATATAMLTGVKTNWYNVGLTSKARMGDCQFPKESEIDTIIQQSEKEGKLIHILSFYMYFLYPPPHLIFIFALIENRTYYFVWFYFRNKV